MRKLIAVTYDTEFKAEEVRLQFLKMQKSYLVSLEDAVVVEKKQNGKVKLHQMYNLTASGAVGGGFWGDVYKRQHIAHAKRPLSLRKRPFHTAFPERQRAIRHPSERRGRCSGRPEAWLRPRGTARTGERSRLCRAGRRAPCR